MPSPFDHRSRPAGPPPPLAESVQRSLERRAQERRLWVARGFTSLIVFGLLVLAFILIRRDRMLQTRYMGSLEQYVTVLNERLDRQRQEGWNRLLLPAEWNVADVKPKPPVSFEFYRYYDATLRQFAQSRKDPTIIAWADQPVPMTLGGDGRPVAIYEDGRVRVEWLKESEFNRRFEQQETELENAIREAERQPVKTPRPRSP